MHPDHSPCSKARRCRKDVKEQEYYIGMLSRRSICSRKRCHLDELMWRWYDLLSLRSNDEIQGLKQQRGGRDAIRATSKCCLRRNRDAVHSEQAAEMAAFEFLARFKAGDSDDMPEVKLAAAGRGCDRNTAETSRLAASTSEAIRNIEQVG